MSLNIQKFFINVIVPYLTIVALLNHSHYAIAEVSTTNSTTQIEATSLPSPLPSPITTSFPCFYAEEELCLQPNETNSCRECAPHPTRPNSLVCCNVTDIEKSISCVQNMDDSSVWQNLHMRNVTVDELDISNKFWKRLESLVITDGHINKITKEFSKFSSPKCINISNNNLLVINQRAFKDLTPLQLIDLSHNKLSTIPNLNSIQGNLSIDIR